MLTEIRDLYDFNRWANRRLLEVTSSLSPAQLGRDLGNSFPSVHDTLVHLLGAEWIWLNRWKGTSPKSMPTEWDLSTHDALLGAWSVVETDQAAFIEALTEEDLVAPLRYHTTRGVAYSSPLHHLMRHVVNHGSYHRGQLVTMLRQLGVEPVGTDMHRYHLERSGQL